MLASAFPTFATHNRAGEIIYRRVDSDPNHYEISIITYTKYNQSEPNDPSNQADRCFLVLYYGHGQPEQRDSVYRANGPSGNDCQHSGEIITPLIKKNVYTIRHRFPGAGRYTIWAADQNRNAGVRNIPNSDKVWFYVESEIVIDAATGGNNAPELKNPPIDNGCVAQIFEHNPGAVDIDGDSLSYSLEASKSFGGEDIYGYFFPDQYIPGSNNVMTIDPRSGTLQWNAPQAEGEYNVAIRIQEWRYNPNSGKRVYVGSILRDIQIDIGKCEDSEPPQLNEMGKVCVQAGRTLTHYVTGNHPNPSASLELSASGFPLDPDGNGRLSPEDVVVGPPVVEMTFEWETNCSHVRRESYWMYFKLKEDSPNASDLVDFEELEIQVVAPPVDILTVQPSGSSLNLNWTMSICDGGNGYDIYRYNDSLGFVGSNCITGVPEELGYVKIGHNDGLDNRSFVDDNNGIGLVHGQRYCYMIVVTFPDQSESYASLEACGQLIMDVPILNKVSVNTTDSANGTDSIAWFRPLELDLSANPPPYVYTLSRAQSLTGPFEKIYESAPSSDLAAMDTVIVDAGLNTRDVQYFYKIELLSGEERRPVGSSRNAGSIFLRSTPSDNTLTLHWSVNVPWTNEEYIVYRFSNHIDSSDVYREIGRTADTTFVDDGLANLTRYRYFVRGTGHYSSTAFNDTLINNSQVHTGMPIDNEVPCPPGDRLIEGDCDQETTEIRWSNPNRTCDDVDDVIGYRIYYAPVLGNTLDLLDSLSDPNDTIFIRLNSESLAGCYAVTSVDSFRNESSFGSPLCIDNCPEYVLPNVFTPGNDGVNDVFEPFPYKYVESIDITIYNRWGREVFHTTDPDIQWDGSHQATGEPLSDGAYYYVCTVNEIRLVGIVQREIRAYVTLLRAHDEGSIPK